MGRFLTKKEKNMKQEMKMILRINKALDAVKVAIETSLSEDEALDVLDAVQLLTDTGVNCNVDTDTYTIYRMQQSKQLQMYR